MSKRGKGLHEKERKGLTREIREKGSLGKEGKGLT